MSWMLSAGIHALVVERVLDVNQTGQHQNLFQSVLTVFQLLFDNLLLLLKFDFN